MDNIKNNIIKFNLIRNIYKISDKPEKKDNLDNLDNLDNNLDNKQYKRIYNSKLDRYVGDKVFLKHGIKSLFSIKGSPSIPTKIDLRNKMPPVYNQGDLGSCTANALCSAVQYILPSLSGSRLFVYYNERMMEGSINEDAGAILGNGVISLCKNGLCSETLWPYDISKFKTKPPVKCYTEALKHKVLKNYCIKNKIQDMKQALISGYPFVVSIAIFESFENPIASKKGIISMPKETENYLGGHAVMCVGFDESKKVWIMRNSWGPNWGDKGYFYLPYDYLLYEDMASDLWAITSIK